MHCHYCRFVGIRAVVWTQANRVLHMSLLSTAVVIYELHHREMPAMTTVFIAYIFYLLHRYVQTVSFVSRDILQSQAGWGPVATALEGAVHL